MGVTPPPPDPLDQFDVFVDPDAEPIDVDEALVEFAVRFLESSAGASTADWSH